MVQQYTCITLLLLICIRIITDVLVKGPCAPPRLPRLMILAQLLLKAHVLPHVLYEASHTRRQTSATTLCTARP